MDDAFLQHRPHLFGVAYRMLGTRTDAEDVVQEAWLRYRGADTSQVADLRAWLTTVVGRLCLDQLRTARARRAAYPGPWLPEPIVERLPADGGDPADAVALRDSVSFALLLVLEALTPEQRVAFVLHDVFGVPFGDVAGTLGTTAENARQLASRGRRAVAAGERRHSTDRARQARALAAFTAAARDGDLAGLVAVLAPDVVALGDGGGVVSAARRPVLGADPVARLVIGLFRRAGAAGWTVEPALVNGDLGLLVHDAGCGPAGEALRARAGVDGLVAVTTAAVAPDGRITGVYNVLNPAKLPDLT